MCNLSSNYVYGRFSDFRGFKGFITKIKCIVFTPLFPKHKKKMVFEEPVKLYRISHEQGKQQYDIKVILNSKGARQV